MKLCLEIIYYQLESYAAELVMNHNESGFLISDVRAYMQGQTLRSDTSYIGTADCFFHNDDQSLICYHEGNYIRFHKTDPFILLNEVLEVFRHFAQWEERCLILLNQRVTLTELLNEGETIIPYPMLVVDASQFILSHSNHMVGMDMVVERTPGMHSLPLELLQKFNQSHADSFKAQRTFWLPADYFPTASAGHHIFENSIRVGTLIVAYTGTPIFSYLSKMIELFIPMLQRWFRNVRHADLSTNATSILAQAIDGKPNASTELECYLNSFGWKTGDKKQLFIAKAVSGNVHFDAHLSHALIDEIHGIFCIPYQQSLSILCNYEIITEKDFQAILRHILQVNKYYACSSFTFTDTNLLPDLYAQICLTLQLTTPETGAIYSSETAIIPLIVKAVNDHLRLPVVHPVLHEIKKYDEQKHTAYYETLFMYLKHERNHQLTAESLFIHRNTLFLRLRKIQDLWNLDLDSPDFRFYLLYSFYHMEQFTSSTCEPL